jgi:pyrroline-5-carboxylate reductase
MNLQNKTIAFIGAGNMAEALLRGLLASKTVQPHQLIATDIRPDRLQYLQTNLAIRTHPDNAAAAEAADIVVLAVKPQHINEALASIKPAITDQKLLISIAAGIPTTRIERQLGGTPRLVRVMPNTPALVGAGAAALCKGTHATDDDLATAEAILGAVGITVRTEEKFLDAVTALSGSGPAYVFFLTEAMIQAGTAMGLPEPLAKTLAIHTVHGAAKLMLESGQQPAALRKNVTSPGGTTEAALNVMAQRNLTGIILDAIRAAERRSRELSAS